MEIQPVATPTPTLSDEVPPSRAGKSAPRAAADPGQVRLRTLTLTRWVAVAGQAGAIMVVHVGLEFDLPLAPAMAVVGALALLNLLIEIGRPAGARIGGVAATWYLAFDIVQLAVLLYLMGGFENPFAFLLLAPVTVSATVLSLRSTMALCALALVCITVLAADHWSLPWSSGGLDLPKIYILGSWVALGLGIAFFASYTWRVAQEARRMSNALSATQLALVREQQLTALDGLAAVAAHELGSPLGTIAVATREIARELPDDSPITEDVNLLISEVARCRDILADLAHRPDGDKNFPFGQLPVDAMVEMTVSRHATDKVALHLAAMAEAGADTAVPTTARSAEIVPALGNLVQNAIEFARADIDVRTRWSETDVTVTIHDDGPGFPVRLLERLGEPYLSVRAEEGEYMGLGIFIAQTLLERTGARITFANRDGAEVEVRWARADFERPAPTA